VPLRRSWLTSRLFWERECCGHDGVSQKVQGANLRFDVEGEYKTNTNLTELTYPLRNLYAFLMQSGTSVL
jgi:hypothetical protein